MLFNNTRLLDWQVNKNGSKWYSIFIIMPRLPKIHILFTSKLFLNKVQHNFSEVFCFRPHRLDKRRKHISWRNPSFVRISDAWVQIQQTAKLIIVPNSEILDS
ncbi:hypothetical protein D3C76_461560 [compost metagenome]